MVTQSGAALENIRVLLVEDNADDEFLAVWVLNRVGIVEVTVARDGREALDYLYGGAGVPGAVPDLVILDLRLPKLDGREVLRRIREDMRTASLPVIILTSSEDVGDKETCRRLGITEFFSKPMKAAALHKALRLIGKG